MTEMTISQMKEEKEKLATLIQTAVNDFSEKTGVKVESINIQRMLTIGHPVPYHLIDIEVKL